MDLKTNACAAQSAFLKHCKPSYGEERATELFLCLCEKILNAAEVWKRFPRMSHYAHRNEFSPAILKVSGFPTSCRKNSPARKNLIGRFKRAFSARKGLVVNITFRVKFNRLCNAFHSLDFRQNFSQVRPYLPCHSLHEEKIRELSFYLTLRGFVRRNFSGKRRVRFQSVISFRMILKTESDFKTDSANMRKMIFLNSLGGIADKTHQADFQIFLPAHVIKNFIFKRIIKKAR